jgi:hypothetical protein
MVDTGVWIELTEGNIKNAHIYLRDVLSFFPEDCIGGSNRFVEAANKIHVMFMPGSTVETDIDGEKRFLRARKQVREFFNTTGAKAGDRVVISKLSPRTFSFRLEPK